MGPVAVLCLPSLLVLSLVALAVFLCLLLGILRVVVVLPLFLRQSLFRLMSRPLLLPILVRVLRIVFRRSISSVLGAFSLRFGLTLAFVVLS